MNASRNTLVLMIVVVACSSALTGCGGASKSSTTSTTSSPPASSSSNQASTPAPATTGGGSSSALTADATSAATGDVPDNVNFLTYTSTKPTFSIKYPEGWGQRAAPDGVTFQDKNNLVRISIVSASAPTPASVGNDLASKAAATPGLRVTTQPAFVKLHGAQVIKAGYSTDSAPNPVTNKRVTLLVDRYVFHQGGLVATLDLGTPKGVDNVDAFRLMSESFAWN